MLTHHKATDKEKAIICTWRYTGEYAIYDMSDYEEMKKQKRGFANPNMYVEAFFEGDLLIGFCNLYDDGDEVFLGIGVNPKSCGQGYGQQMMNTIYTVSKELFPNKPLYLEVRTWNKRAICCYKKAGFKIDGPTISQETQAGKGEFYRMIKA